MAWNIKNCNFVTESGRSMIEMLGVLAVIGVLSVAGLAGYSKAIERYKVNETINQITYIVQNTRNLFKTQPDLYGSMSFDLVALSDSSSANRQITDKAKIFPEALVKNDYKNLFGGNIRFAANGRFTANDGKAFVLEFFDIPQEACIELATRDWNYSLGMLGMAVHQKNKAKEEYYITTRYSGNCSSKYKDGEGVICAADMPLPIEKAVQICGSSAENYFTWKFY